LVVLAEYNKNIMSLRQQGNNHFVPIYNTSGYIKAMINSKYGVVDTLRDQSLYMIVKIKSLTYTLIVGMIHNNSKLFYDDADLEMRLKEFHDDLCQCEREHNCSNSILIGDFNVNPFENACIGANNLHAIPFKEEARRTSRRTNSKDRLMFYNPTWKLFGNAEPPYTTYYYNRSGKNVNYYWYALDQVIIRPRLIDAFDEDKLVIIKSTKNHTLIKNGKPDKINYSDHLPLLCSLREEII